MNEKQRGGFPNVPCFILNNDFIIAFFTYGFNEQMQGFKGISYAPSMSDTSLGTVYVVPYSVDIPKSIAMPLSH